MDVLLAGRCPRNQASVPIGCLRWRRGRSEGEGWRRCSTSSGGSWTSKPKPSSPGAERAPAGSRPRRPAGRCGRRVCPRRPRGRSGHARRRRIETPRSPEGWTAAATTHPDDGDGLGAGVAFRIASVTKRVTPTALLVLADRGRCGLDDPTGHCFPGDVVDRFRDSDGRGYGAAITLGQLLDHTSALPNYFSHPSILDAVRHGGGQRRFTPLDLVNLAGPGRRR